MEFGTSTRYAVPPIDPAMRIRQAKEMMVGPYGVLHQAWEWEGVGGENLVFMTDDVAHLTDEELRGIVRSSSFCRKRSELTVLRDTRGCIVVSFNFLIFGNC
ncbi:MAG: hypothetical protein KKH60_01950 [Proteobacteria bacterium]|nr:hypothetical protein [Pseudomonadota bacterium]MBU1139115.1 hypothetical protein [Pseudomonadota bacterium]